jgi:hypothetical protein
MEQEKLKEIATKEIEKENFKNWKFNGNISLNDEVLTQKNQEYIGEILYEDEDDGEEVSSVFTIYVYTNGTHQFEW